MNTHNIIEIERGRLALIGSNKDPALFQAMRAHVRDQRTQNRSVIVNFADDETRFGCRFRCKFCSWRDRAIEAGDIAPTRAALEKFLDGFAGYKVTISGGGDPLFKLDQNWTRLHELIGWIHELGFLAEVVTKETVLVENVLGWGSLLASKRPGMYEAIQRIDAFSLSFENYNPAAVSNVKAISAQRPVRVSKVCTPGFSAKNRVVKDREVNFLRQYCSAFRGAGAYQIVLRQDFYDPRVTEQDAKDIGYVVRDGRGTVRWLPNKTCSDNLFLIGEETYMGDAALGGKKNAVQPFSS